MFFDDAPLELRRKVRLKALPPTPETGWRPPTEFPNLSAATAIGFDVETKELDWEHGPGWARGPKGHIVGFSLSARDKLGNSGRWYFPVRHEYEPEYNLDPNNCFNFLRYILHNSSTVKVGAALTYDIGWLTEEQIYVQGQLYDCQYAESLLDEDAATSLDELGLKYESEGKDTSELYRWIDAAYNPHKRERRGELWRTSPRLVGPYGEQDADLPIRILGKQWPKLHRDGLLDVFHMECDLIRLLVRMRMAGVRIDVNYAEQLYHQFAEHVVSINKEIHDATGHWVNVSSSAEVAKAFDSVGIEYPLTDKGNPSFIKEFLENLKHPVATLIVKQRKFEKLNSTFIKGYLLEGNTNGYVYTNFHPLRTNNREEKAGTKTGRFSSEGPNLQNIPVRTEEGRLIRACFIPEPGHVTWRKKDYSQMEYRYLAHYAVGPGADQLRAEYNQNPYTDYHDKVYYAACPYMGWNPADENLKKEKRRPIKNTNFGLVYGQGQGLLATKLGLGRKEAADFFDGYHKAAPWVKPTMAEIASEVQTYGYITTIMGRRVRFKYWEPIFWPHKDRPIPLEYEWALREWGMAIKRAGDYKGINYKLQGGNAETIKKSMVECYKAGVFDVTGMPKLTVHDELDFSVIDNSSIQNEAYIEMTRIMETCLPLRVPVIVDTKDGINWAKAD